MPHTPSTIIAAKSDGTPNAPVWSAAAHNDIIGREFGQILPLLSVIGRIDAVAFVRQVHFQRVAQVMIIFNYQNAHGERCPLLLSTALHLSYSHYGISR
jgi:hypothetical protein